MWAIGMDRELKTPSTVLMAASQRRLKAQGHFKWLSLNLWSTISDLTTDCIGLTSVDEGAKSV